MKIKITIILIALLAIAVSVIVSSPYNLNFSDLWNQLLNNHWALPVIILSIALQFIGHYLRSIKHAVILNRVRPVKTVEIFKGQSIGYLFNFILPFRLGELIRAHYIARGISISRSAVFATIVFERFVDVLVMLLLAIPLFILLTGTSYIATAISVTVALAVIAVIIGSLLYAARTQQVWLLRLIHAASSIFNDSIRDRIRLMSWSAIYILKNAIDKQIIIKYLALTLFMWLFYLFSTLILVIFLLQGIAFHTQWLTTEATYYGISVPSGPAYLTTFQNIFTNVTTLSAAFLHNHNITLIMWFVTVAPISLVGLVLLILPHKKYHEQQSDMIMVLKNKLYRDVDISKDFSHFLDAYFYGSKINRILTSEELANNFKIIRTFRGGSSALTLLAWQDNRMVVKKITLKQYQDKLKAQYDWLHERAKYPEIANVLGEQKSDEFYSIDIEYQEEYIPFFDFIHSSSTTESSEVLTNVLRFMSENVYHSTASVINTKLADEYIMTKAVGKITEAANVNMQIQALSSFDTIVVNGKRYANFYQILEKITSNSKAMQDIASINETPIHGDLTIDNIIVNPKDNKFIILDPNNENAISDQVVDLGKMMQSVHSGYEFLVLLSQCKVKRNEVTFEESKSSRYEDLYESLVHILKNDLSESRYRTVLFHEAIHYCRMLPYRCDLNPETAPLFYTIAVRLFNDFYSQYEK